MSAGGVVRCEGGELWRGRETRGRCAPSSSLCSLRPGPQILTASSFEKEVLGSGRATLLLLHTPHCPHCKARGGGRACIGGGGGGGGELPLPAASLT